MSDNDLITVCAECKQASCWQGVFMCQNSRRADVVKMNKRELAALNLEHSDYWKTDSQLSDEANEQAQRFNSRTRRRPGFPRVIAR